MFFPQHDSGGCLRFWLKDGKAKQSQPKSRQHPPFTASNMGVSCTSEEGGRGDDQTQKVLPPKASYVSPSLLFLPLLFRLTAYSAGTQPRN